MSFRVAFPVFHTSPLATPGSGDAGGMNVFVVGLAEALLAQGVEVELLTRATGAADEVEDARTPGGVPVRFLEAGPREPLPKSALSGLAPAFAASAAALGPFDLVHSHYWLSGLAGLELAAAWGVPHVLSLHTVAALKNERLAPGDTAEPAERLAGERMLVHGSALTVTHTAAERRAILDAYAADPGRVVEVAPGVDTALFHTAAERPDDPFLLVLARIQPLKGVDLAIEALAAIPSGRRPRLVVAGGTSPGHDAYAQGLRDRVDELGLTDVVRFLPAQERKGAARLLREASLLLVPSHSETFGMVALEAAASGTPVVAAATSGLTESVEDGVSGILLDSRDPAVWAEAIDTLLGDPGRRAALAASALEFGKAHDWAASAAAIAEHYRAIAQTGALARLGAAPVFLHAHPDDESISTGGTIAALRASGTEVVILTGTRGERGEVVPGELKPLEGTAALAPHRQTELAAALGALGGPAHVFLGTRPARAPGLPERSYSDSGMRWGSGGLAEAADDADPDALSLAPLAEVTDDVLAGIRSLASGATAIVSYDAIGGYGHPDHVRMHEAGVAAARALGIPFYAIVEPRVESSAESSEDDRSGILAIPVDPVAKSRAMAAHRSQLTIVQDDDGIRFTLSGGQTHPVSDRELFRGP